ncbi:MAG: hypothetical protein N838_27160 [Thiohalocapsa sp. PB-PSB1]|nr:MAG: hypothetical protein N838_27160 [Thiohalocapsa sp. PB-PSB1]
MYVTIVATGLINTLMTVSDIVGRKRKNASIHTAWIVLLLISYFGFFWETTAILDVEGWDFLSFLAFIAGPVVLLFATNLIIAAPDAGSDPQLDEFYFDLSSRFFVMLALVQGWIIGLDVVFDTITYETYFYGRHLRVVCRAGRFEKSAATCRRRVARRPGVGVADASAGDISRSTAIRNSGDIIIPESNSGPINQTKITR